MNSNLLMRSSELGAWTTIVLVVNALKMKNSDLYLLGCSHGSFYFVVAM